MALMLTEYEKQMLDGDFGVLKQKAIEKIVEYAGALDANELCEVSMAHLFCGAHRYLNVVGSDDIETVISQMHLCSDEKIRFEKMACFCQSDCGPMDPKDYLKMEISEKEGRKNQEYLDYYLNAGVNLVGSCVPYLVGFVPLMGEHYVTSESHAVLMMNSLWGACGNADGLEAGFWSAISGRTPKWGNHIMDNRKGTHIFEINCTTDSFMEWDLLGYSIGKKLPTHSIPIITGSFKRPTLDKLKYFYAAMATTSGAEMCHIVGITPEAKTLAEALGNKKAQEIISINDVNIQDSLRVLSDQESGNVDYISLGCPHYSIEEIREVASFLEGKNIHRDTVLHVWTAAPIKEIAINCGYVNKIEDAGGIVLTSSCPLTSEKLPAGTKAIAFDSAKQAHYIKAGSEVKVYYGSKYTCLESAISGIWEG